MKDILRNDITTLLKRLTIAIVVSLLLKLMFYVFNYESFGAISWSELPTLIHGMMIFDAANFALVFGLFIIISLIPVRQQSSRLFERLKFWSFTLGTSILVVFGLIDTIYFHFVGRRGMADDLSFASNDNTAGIMFKAATENILVIICGVIIAAAAIVAYRKIKYHPTSITSAKKFYSIGALSLLTGIFCLFFMVRGSTLSGHPLLISQASRYVAEPNRTALVLCNPLCIIHTAATPSQKYTKYFTDDELAKIYSPIHMPNRQDAIPQSEISRKNVVIFILEGFSREMSGYLNPELYKPGESTIPFLDSLMRQGLIFRNAYSNGGSSRDAMSAVYNSIPSFKEIFMQMPQSFNATSSIATILNEEGYHSAFFNGSDKTLMGFDDYARLIGFKKTYSQGDYVEKYGMDKYDGRWGIWDEPFLQYMGEEISQFQQPFLASVFTITSHHPFTVPDKYKNLPKGYTKSHQSMSYTDLALRNFFERFKDEEWFRNTIFVMVADHISPEIYAQKTRTTVGAKSIIYFLYAPDGSLTGESDAATQQIDIMPTVLGLLNYEKPYFAFGQDIFAVKPEEGYAISYGSGFFQWINNDKCYLFDETAITNVYAHTDTLQKRNIVGQNPQMEHDVETKIKAFIQSYYQQLEKSDFTVK